MKIGWNRFHWKIVIDGKAYLSAPRSIDDAIFSACRRHEFDIRMREHPKFPPIKIEIYPVTRPLRMSFAEFQRKIEK